ncbi:BlaR1 peptidase M56 [Pedobacter africanus]|uniref:BlaR1 peptidase M56 n=2 Tax=Pedobacter africanus TaxID=151894 RepID=A0A1W2DYT6_9SPHI|nr:BlaR1 peptidase M56 [Pedobacter africanus]
MNTLYYLLEANIYLAVFYGFYRLFLYRETFYTLNRYYLIATTALAFALPLLQLGYLYNLIGRNAAEQASTEITKIAIQPYPDLNLMVYSYIAIAAVFLIRFLINLSHIILRAFQNPRTRKDNVVYIELPGSETAFSFFKYLFINPQAADKSTIIRHELVHIHQKHSADIVFFEIIRILGWFNPVTYFLKKDIKLLHEYIADEVTTGTVQKHEYAMFLIQNSFGVVPNQLTNQIFNQSILKMRINMLNKKRSAGRARLRLLLALPLAAGMLCASTMAFTKDYTTVDLYPEKYKSVSSANQDTLKKVAPPSPPAPPKPKKRKSETVEVKTVKFSPPKVVRNKEGKVVERKIKFPPPIVKADKKNENEPPPPPPVEVIKIQEIKKN